MEYVREVIFSDSWILRFLIIEHLIFQSILTSTLILTLNLTLILTLLKVVRTRSYIFQESNLTFVNGMYFSQIVWSNFGFIMNWCVLKIANLYRRS